MTIEEAIKEIKYVKDKTGYADKALDMAIKALEQQPCEDADYEYPLTMPTEEYRLRMIRAFHNADCDELIALVVIPTEKEFEHLEWLLKTHYKKQPCEDCISREDVLKALNTYPKFACMADCKLEPFHNLTNPDEQYEPYVHYADVYNCVINMPSVKPTRAKGKWIEHGVKEGHLIEKYTCSECDYYAGTKTFNYCPNCGAEMRGDEN